MAIMPKNAAPMTAGKMICAFVIGNRRGAIGESRTDCMPPSTLGALSRRDGLKRIVDNLLPLLSAGPYVGLRRQHSHRVRRAMHRQRGRPRQLRSRRPHLQHRPRRRTNLR